MTTAIILVTHPGIGNALLSIAKRIMTNDSYDISVFEIEMDKDCDKAKQELKQMIHSCDKGQGVLILNDIYGATPFNIAKDVLDDQTRLISGVNLAMLLRAINYQSLTLDELSKKTRDGGVNGVRLLE